MRYNIIAAINLKQVLLAEIFWNSSSKFDKYNILEIENGYLYIGYLYIGRKRFLIKKIFTFFFLILKKQSISGIKYVHTIYYTNKKQSLFSFQRIFIRIL